MVENEKDPLDIINDPANKISVDQAYKLDEDDVNDKKTVEETKKSVSRRNFLKLGGAVAAVASVAASGAAGFATGRSADAYTGQGRTVQGEDMFFNRDPFRVDVAPMMTPVGEVTRPHWTENLLFTWSMVMGFIGKKQWNPSMGMEAIPNKDLVEYYKNNPGRYESLVERIGLHVQRLEYFNTVAYKQFAIADAYNLAYRVAQASHAGSTIPEEPHDVFVKTGEPQPPEKWDYRRVNKKKMEFKSPAHATKLIKRMAHIFGAPVVGICKFDERFMFRDFMRGMPNHGADWGDKVPSHWKSIIVFGTPMNWDTIYASIGYSTSMDGYFKTRCVAGLMETFIQRLGHPARAQFPGLGFEVMAAPYVMLSGLAEYSRAGLVMVPELGSNFRTGAVITDIEFEYDKPIDINMGKFCKKCKICAETCPSGAITFDDEPTKVVRGFKRWVLDEEKCHQMWVAGSTSNGNGCRVCIAVCPYTRKNTWIHTISRELEPRDPTGMVASGLLAMQQNFFKYPAGEEFRAPWNGGREAQYHDPVWWERSEEFFGNIQQDWEYQGMH